MIVETHVKMCGNDFLKSLNSYYIIVLRYKLFLI